MSLQERAGELTSNYYTEGSYENRLRASRRNKDYALQKGFEGTSTFSENQKYTPVGQQRALSAGPVVPVPTRLNPLTTSTVQPLVGLPFFAFFTAPRNEVDLESELRSGGPMKCKKSEARVSETDTSNFASEPMPEELIDENGDAVVLQFANMSIHMGVPVAPVVVQATDLFADRREMIIPFQKTMNPVRPFPGGRPSRSDIRQGPAPAPRAVNAISR